MDSPPTRTITFLFTDLEGSTRRWEQFPQAMPGALGRHDAIVRAAIEGSGGTVVKTTGDGMMAVFDGAIEAATASLAAQRGLIAEPWGETGPLQVRMGIHCGQAELREGDYFGTTVNRAARIMAAGHGGQVLLSASAASLVVEQLPAGAALRNLGEHHLRDLGRPEHLYQLLHPDLPPEFPPLVTARQPGADLPSRVAALIGRRDEIARISERLADGSVRLLTLIGPGGTGKTTLAIRVATDLADGFRDGASFVDLSSAHDINAVLVAVARAVGLGEIIDRPLQEELVDRLRERRMLLVLDNLEQVTVSAGVVAQLLSDCPGLTILATSREPLHVRAEQLFPVPPLALPPDGRGSVTAAAIRDIAAVQLFVDRARVVRPEFEISDGNAAAVAEICRRLDGLPLAIELAAARLRLFSPEVLRDRLDDRLGLLRSGPRDLPERQQTLRAAMDWSYELLSPGEQRLFEMLAPFASAEVTAIQAVIDDAGAVDGEAVDDEPLDVLDGLAGLVEKSLLRRVDAPGGETRVGMLETIRAFAADRLGQRPELASQARRAHATYYADRARRLLADLTGASREGALATLDADVANLRIAWRFWVGSRDLEQLDKLAKTLLIVDDAHGWYLETTGLASDMLAVLDAAPSSADRVNQEIALRITMARALMVTKGYTPEVEAAFGGAIDLFERGVDVRLQFSVLRGLASLYMFRAQLDEVERIGHQILALAGTEQDDGMRIDGHLLVGTTLVNLEDLPGGLAHLDQAIALFPSGRPRPGRRASATTLASPASPRPHSHCGCSANRIGPPNERMPRSPSPPRSTTRSRRRMPCSTRACCDSGAASPGSRSISRRVCSISPMSTSSGSGRRRAPCCSGRPTSSLAASRPAWRRCRQGSACTACSGRRRSSGRSCCSCRRRRVRPPGDRPTACGCLTTACTSSGPRVPRSCRRCTSSVAISCGRWRRTKRWAPRRPSPGTSWPSIVRSCSGR